MARQVKADLDQYAKLKAKKELSPEEKAVVEAYVAVDEASAAVVDRVKDTVVEDAIGKLKDAQEALVDKPVATV